ncbi:aquaporin-like protein [Leucosporidium creatinivorum]|uniref:Aquaporin-like protein n=1 Tax=Leucosporidium creatinivorum TaxID=106004 RepID=A0A1Y2FZY7_9BASI|nr:aquaporin-like protein [Leucosporidium creatinivorum]
MQAQRGHLDRAAGDIETGIADVLQPRRVHNAAPQQAPPQWLVTWETRRPTLVMECFAEFLGVFFYCLFGIGASAAFFTTAAAKVEGYGNLLTVGLAYGMGIALAVITASATSGGHLSPCYTIAFWAFKGFPARKVPFYLISQIFGAMVATWCVYGMYKVEFDAIHEALVAAGPIGQASIYTPSGPAGILALFPGTGQQSSYLFLTEFMANLVLAIVVFTCLDGSTFTVSMATVPFVIALSYSSIIWAFAPASVALNTARDLGGRIACSAVYGHGCFTAHKSYTVLACLTNIPATLIGGFIQTTLLSDTAREILHAPPHMMEAARSHNERNGHDGMSLRSPLTRDGLSLRAITRDGNGTGSNEKTGYIPQE